MIRSWLDALTLRQQLGDGLVCPSNDRFIISVARSTSGVVYLTVGKRTLFLKLMIATWLFDQWVMDSIGLNNTCTAVNLPPWQYIL